MATRTPSRIEVVDSHTGGEPTRVIVRGGPDLGGGTLAERRERFRQEFDSYRTAVANEPRGSDVLVGALLCAPTDPACATGVIFFNNAGYLGMCGHGTIGVVVTLAHLGRIGPGRHQIETPVGVVGVQYAGGHEVTFDNVRCYRLLKGVTVEVEGYGPVTGDVAWGGNWFFLTDQHRFPIDLHHVEPLTDYAWHIRAALHQEGITGRGGAEIDHIDLIGPPYHPTTNSRNFVLCPGKAYDRSPCGTGTSAKLACLVADGKFGEEQRWRQESIVGSIFEGSVRIEGDQVIPTITGSAYVCAEATLLVDPADPFRLGIPS